MKISILGPTNLDKFSNITGKNIEEIETIAKDIGKTLAKNKCKLVVVFNYSGMMKLVGNSYKKHGGKLEMLYTENDYDWYTNIYMKHLKEADIKTKKESWHDMLLSLVTDSDIVVCTGLSAGVLVELGYMKWNNQENKGKVKALIGVKEFLKNGFPPELSDLNKLIDLVPVKNLEETMNMFKN